MAMLAVIFSFLYLAIFFITGIVRSVKIVRDAVKPKVPAVQIAPSGDTQYWQ